MLDVVVGDAHQANAERDWRIPPFIDDSIEVGGTRTGEQLRRPCRDGLVVADEDVGAVWPHPRDLLGAVPVSGVVGSLCSPKRAGHGSLVHTCSRPSSSDTWWSWTRVRCHTSHPIVLAPGAGASARSAAESPSTAGEDRRESARTVPSAVRLRPIFALAPVSCPMIAAASGHHEFSGDPGCFREVARSPATQAKRDHASSARSAKSARSPGHCGACQPASVVRGVFGAEVRWRER